MRAIHVTPYFAPAFCYGGPPRSILGLCRGLRSASVDVEVLTTTADGMGEISQELVRQREYEGVPVRYLPRSFPRHYFNAARFGSVLRDALGDADLVHAHGLWSFPVWIAAYECRRAGVPFVVSPRGMLDAGSLAHHRWRKRIGYWAWEQRYLRRAALLHATSATEAENLERLSLGPRVVRVANGVSPPASVPERGFRKRLGMGVDAPLVVFLGRLHPIKRIDLLVAALDIVRGERGDVRLALAGPEDGIDVGALIQRASDPNAVQWIGEVAGDDKWSLLAESDVVVSCSDSESFGMSIVEAMAMATPVVTTTTCPWKEIETERAGFWVPQTAEAIADAILRAVWDRKDARAMGERGRKLVGDRYRWSAIGRSMRTHYESVVA